MPRMVALWRGSCVRAGWNTVATESATISRRHDDEVVEMEFTITCPLDGAVEVGLEDVETVVLRDTDQADITFVCPHCGSQLTVTAIVPSFLLAAMEALASESGMPEVTGIIVTPDASDPVESLDEPHADAYCEYFRRQLDAVSSAEDALAEIDSRARSL
jgi:transcription elongation factor Elf1